MKARFALVTGGAGFLGSHLVDRLVSEGWSVRVLDNFSSGRMENIEHHRGNRKVEILRGDLKSPKEAVRDVNVVFHYTSNPEVNKSGDTLQRDHSGNFQPSIDRKGKRC